MSLATNMAVADALFEARTGLFRTMPRVDESRLGRLRHTARAFGLEWPKAQSLKAFESSLPKGDPKTSAFQLSVRRASGGASYEPFDPNEKPWHAAVAATYSHATAPLRRLADRYVIEAALAVANGRPVADEVEQAFEALPQAMRQGDTRANRVDRAAIDLAEAVVLQGREGDVFEAVVTDEDKRGVRIQIGDPAIVARVVARRVDPGDDIQVKLVKADPDTRKIEFERVG
jgi:exoribonuclease R